MTEKLSQTKLKKTQRKTEVVEIKQQVTAMEELTMSLSTQTQEKDKQIEKLKGEIIEKDMEFAIKMKDLDHSNSQFRQSLEEEQRKLQSLKSENQALQEELEHKKIDTTQ